MKAEEFQKELQRALLEDPERYDPLEIGRVTLRSGDSGVDGHLQLGWGGKAADFELQTSPRSAPSVAWRVLESLENLEIAGTKPTYPLLAVPYLSETLRTELEERRISGIDLNGNYCIFTDELLALRSDRENEYAEQKDIKNIYSRNSSIVGRLFLLETGKFERVKEVHQEILSRGGDISLSTVSKVTSGLAEDLTIEKKRGSIRVLQPGKLLDNLRKGYVEPRVTETVRLKQEDLTDDLLADRLDGDWVWSGTASATEYAVTTPDQEPELYTRQDRIDELKDLENERFYDCTARATDDSFVYFDARDGTASPIQAYLELAQGGKRDRQIAETIREQSLSRFEEVSP